MAEVFLERWNINEPPRRGQGGRIYETTSYPPSILAIRSLIFCDSCIILNCFNFKCIVIELLYVA